MDCVVFIKVYKVEGLIDLIVNDSQVEVVIFVNVFLVFDIGIVQWINVKCQVCFLNCCYINDIGQFFYEWLYQILFFYMIGCYCFVEGDMFYVFQVIGQQCVGMIFYYFSDVGISWVIIWWIVFDIIIFWWVMGWCNNDIVCQWVIFFIVNQDGIGNGRCWGEVIVFLYNNIYVVCCQYFQNGNKCRFGQGVSIFIYIVRVSDIVFCMFFSNCLSDCQNVWFVKVVVCCIVMVIGSIEFYCVFCIFCFWFQYIILCCQLGDVN